VEKLLMHKDHVVANLNIEPRQKITINEVYDEKRMPIGGQNEENLNTWLLTRNLPKSRNNFELITEQIGICDSRDFILFASGSSLTDCYWFAKEEDVANNKLSWEEVNFHDNSPHSNIGQILFFGDKAVIDGFETPDIATNGHLKKFWMKSNDKWYLVKSQEKRKQEVLGEIMAAKIAHMAGINAVNYYYTNIDGKVCSVCPCVVTNSDGPEMMSISDIMREGVKRRELPLFASEFHAKRDFENMFYLDYLICNEDRNDWNLAFLRNPDTLKLIGMSPLFDHGESFGYDDFNHCGIQADFVRSNITGNTLNKDFLHYASRFKPINKKAVEEEFIKTASEIGVDRERTNIVLEETLKRVSYANRTIERERGMDL